MSAIFHHPTASGQTHAGALAPAAATSTSPSPSQAPSSGAQPQPAKSVDVEAVLTDIASKKGGGGNWRNSIVDLLKLLDLDFSLAARKSLAGELNVRAGADGSAEENIALHKAVMNKLAENGGKVPEVMRS